MKMTLRALFAVISVLTFSASPLAGQDYLNAAGNPTFAVNIPIDNGFVNISNGNLHLEFHLATHKQRGALNLDEKLVYDSRFWIIGHYSNYYWWPDNVPRTTELAAGWRFVSGNDTGTLNTNLTGSDYTCDADASSGNHYHDLTYTFSWRDPSGTTHQFNAQATTHTADASCPSQPTVNPLSISGWATDASGYSITATGDTSNFPQSVSVRDSDGTQVYPQVADRYGNYWSNDSNGNLVDDLGRTPCPQDH